MKKPQLIFLSILLLATFSVFAQVVVTSPGFPTIDDSVTITFDASQGNKGLENFNGEIYAHTGVITNLSSSPTDWKYVKTDWGENTPAVTLEKIQSNVYQLQINPSIREYYGIPEDEQVLQLTFVFRNNDGSITGRDTDGSDIYAQVFEPGLNLKFVTPDNDLIVKLNDTIFIKAQSSSADSLLIKLDNVTHKYTTGNEITDTIIVEEDGIHWIKAIAKNDTEEKADSIYFYVRTEITTSELPEGMIDGVNYINDTTATLVLYAPGKEYAFAIGDFSNWELHNTITNSVTGQVSTTTYMMNKTPDEKRFWITLNGLESGKEYIYQYYVDGNIKIADPYTDKTSDPWMDQYISDEIYPDLIEYPAGKTTEIASVFQTAQTPFQWDVEEFTPPAKEDLVIYELLIRDFTANGDYNTVKDTLDYLENLGINAIEFMPFSEFEGNDSWGYNPSFYFAADKAYGTKDDLKELIDECHKRGIAVIMDLVLNHSYGQSPLARLYLENGAPSEDSPWYNVSSPNPTYFWGYDFNHESQDTKDFIDRVSKYWLTEYKVDGFRFDFTKGFTNTPGEGWYYDQSRVDILKRMASKIWEVNSNAYVILEHLTENSEEIELSNSGILLWGNMNGSYTKASMGWVYEGNSDLSWGAYTTRDWSKPNLITYMESHDEERLMYKNLNNANSGPGYDIKEIWNALPRIELSAAFFLTIPGPKMIWQFGELGYDYSINYNGRVGRKPVKWDYFDVNDRKRLYQVYSALIKLKINEPAFKSIDFTLDVADKMKSIHINHSDMKVIVVGNFGVEEGEVDPEFPYPGLWYEYFSGEDFIVESLGEMITLQAGEYKMFTSKKLTKPEIIANIDIAVTDENGYLINVYPNPANSKANILVNSNLNTEINIDIYNITGHQIATVYTGEVQPGITEFEFNVDNYNLSKGVYFIRLQSQDEITTQKFIIR